MRERLETHERVEPDPVDARLARLHLPLVQRRGQTWVLKGPGAGNRPDPVLVRALRSAHAMVRYDDAGLPVLVTAPGYALSAPARPPGLSGAGDPESDC